MAILKNRYYEQGTFPKNLLCFKEEQISEVLTIPCQKPDIKHILSLRISPEIEDIKVINTEIGRSNEGQILTGKALITELKIKERITYSADEITQPVYSIYYKSLKSSFIIVPNKIDNEDIYNLYREKRIVVTPYVEADYIKSLDSRTIFTCLFLFIDVKFIL
ncbi:hypothetical protein SAMN02745163_02035 [Clostridium cavendishii DSM 21758]|uniref:Uncharacterized protein n=1 Tax=Clostridium cavendishii DSM 21758 TaxID=1121302 RepID=A0A1M6JHN3_9CLOT|nr:hypothetical protein [Clostridium cavendishii]SHJ46229.1 hypothetical protein SAMN02745163_02035 [Clostridium cavendishii DSM 21758]